MKALFFLLLLLSVSVRADIGIFNSATTTLGFVLIPPGVDPTYFLRYTIPAGGYHTFDTSYFNSCSDINGRMAVNVFVGSSLKNIVSITDGASVVLGTGGTITNVTSPAIGGSVISYPALWDAFCVGLAAPLGLWGVMMMATVVKRGIRLGGGVVCSDS